MIINLSGRTTPLSDSAKSCPIAYAVSQCGGGVTITIVLPRPMNVNGVDVTEAVYLPTYYRNPILVNVMTGEALTRPQLIERLNTLIVGR